MEEQVLEPEIAPIDKAAILGAIFKRNALRREAQLPLLNVRKVFEHEIEAARWQEICQRHYERVRAEVLAGFRAKRGPDFGNSAGGRWAVEIYTRRALLDRYWR